MLRSGTFHGSHCLTHQPLPALHRPHINLCINWPPPQYSQLRLPGFQPRACVIFRSLFISLKIWIDPLCTMLTPVFDMAKTPLLKMLLIVPRFPLCRCTYTKKLLCTVCVCVFICVLVGACCCP